MARPRKCRRVCGMPRTNSFGRTTVQGIFNDARRKLADALVNGKMLFIEGGDIDICERENAGCGRKCGQLCRKEMKDEKNKRNLGDEFDE